MKKFLFPALVTMMMAAAPTAMAAGPWYVLFDSATNSCDAAHRLPQNGQEQTVAGPFSSQIDALSAIDSIGACGGQSYGGMQMPAETGVETPRPTGEAPRASGASPPPPRRA